MESLRRRAAKMARDYEAGHVTWDAFIREFSECDDELVTELVDLIEHEPKRGGFLGVSESKWEAYWDGREKAWR